jgi:3-hydroxyacyl-CoA dehydrogenase
LANRIEEALARGLANLRGMFEGSVKRGRMMEAQAAERLAGVPGTTAYAKLSDVDLTMEAVPEKISLKRAVFAGLAAACRPDAILATNTSYLDPRGIAEGLPIPRAGHWGSSVFDH